MGKATTSHLPLWRDGQRTVVLMEQVVRGFARLIWFLAWVTQAFIFVALAHAECSGPPSTRSHLVDKGGEVYDTETDLTWAKCSVGMKWFGGKCIGVAARGSWEQANGANWPDGWRVPSFMELETIVATNCKDPSIDEQLFPKTVRDLYWTARTESWTARTDSRCWAVNFVIGGSFIQSCSRAGAVRLVRRGQ